MKKRKIIKILEEKCVGCGICAESCAEGAIQIINGKARLVNEVFCDGLGACIKECPYRAIVIEEREAKPYDEIEALKNISQYGKDTIIAHLKHLKEHGQTKYYRKAINYLKKRKIKIDEKRDFKKESFCKCPGSRDMSFEVERNTSTSLNIKSQLRQWPIKAHLINPEADYFKNSNLLIAADCCAFAYGDFHRDFIQGKSVVIACPKLDSDTDVYVDKLVSLIDNAKVKSIDVVTMEVPCCFGLLNLVEEAINKSNKKPKVNHIIISIKGEKNKIPV